MKIVKLGEVLDNNSAMMRAEIIAANNKVKRSARREENMVRQPIRPDNAG
jgi:hypothetical protein